VTRFLIAAVLLFGAAHAQTSSPWAGAAHDSAPQPPVVKACKKELAPLWREIAKRTVELRDAPGFHTACTALGKLVEAEDGLISFLQSKPECQTSSVALDRWQADYAKSRDKLRGCPVREIAGF
jgi:hypothetical protein